MTNPDQKLSNLDLTLLDSLLAHVAIVDTQGNIIESNKSWKSFNSENTLLKRAEIGENYFDILQHAVEMGNDYALKSILGLKQVIDEERDAFSLTYPLKTNNDSFWFKVTVQPCDDEHSQFIMIHEDVTSTIQAKKDFQKTENRYQIQFKQNLDGILITDTNGCILDANPAASKILGWSREELITRTHDGILDVQNPTYEEALKKRKQKGSYRLEMELTHKDGEKIPVEISSREYRNKSGKLRAIVTFKDISRRKSIEKDLIKSKHFTELILDSIPGAFFVINQKGEFVRWNTNMTTKLGYSDAELSDKNAMDFIVEEDKSEVNNKIKKCLSGKELALETRAYNKEGEIRDYYISAKRFIEDDEKFIVGAALDMTQEKRIESENRKNQLKLEQLFDNSPVGITIVDTNNNIQNVNSSFEHIFGYTRNEIQGNDIDKLLAPQNKENEAKAISLATQNGESLQTETVRLNKEGEEVPVLIGSVPVKLQGEIIAIYGMYVDVSTQHNFQEKLKSALCEKEALLSELHHRVKNNLALINSLVELQLFDAKNDELQNELQNIKNRIMTIASIHEVLYQNGNLTNIPFNTFIDELFNKGIIKESESENNVHINTFSENIYLNINQSIPTGLLLNELLSLIFSHTDEDEVSEADIQLKQYGQNIHLVIEGDNLIRCPKEIKQNQSMHSILIQTLVMQLNGTLLWPTPDSDYQKFEFFFTKENGTSPASEFLEVTK